MMDQKELSDSISKQLDAVAEMVYWALLLAFVFLWAGLTKQDPIKALGMDVARGYALFIACGVYLIANIFTLIQFLRLADTLSLIDDSSIVLAVTRLCTNKWVANPFAFFGTRLTAKIHGSAGLGLLIFVWWIGNASLYSLADNALSPAGLALQAIFFVIGLASMLASQRVSNVILSRLERVSPDLYAQIRQTMPYRYLMIVAGIVFGVLVALAVLGILDELGIKALRASEFY